MLIRKASLPLCPKIGIAVLIRKAQLVLCPKIGLGAFVKKKTRQVAGSQFPKSGLQLVKFLVPAGEPLPDLPGVALSVITVFVPEHLRAS